MTNIFDQFDPQPQIDPRVAALWPAQQTQESANNPNAVSPKGAFGLAQLMPGTARDPGFGVAPYNPAVKNDDVRVGQQYMGKLLDKYGGNQATALAAYNWGPGHVDRWLAAGGNPAQLPAETRNYVSTILKNSASRPEAPTNANWAGTDTIDAAAPHLGAVGASNVFDQFDAARAQTPDRPIRAQDQIRALAQGGLAGFGDEAEAATRATYAKSTGDPRAWTDIYNSYLSNARNMQQRFSNAHPGEAAFDEAVGAVGSLLIPGPDVISSATWLGRGANAAAKGAAYGGLSGFGSGEGGLENRASNAAQGAAVGGLVGGIASPLTEIAAKGVGRLVQPFVAAANPEAVAASRVASNITADQAAGKGLSNTQFSAAQAAGAPVSNLERGGENTLALMRSSANSSPEARQTIEGLVDPRFSEQGDRLNSFLANTVNGADSMAARADLQAQAQKLRAPAYNAAYAAGNKEITSPEIARLAGSPDVAQAMKDAARTAQSRAVANGNPAPNPQVKNLQYWDYVKRELDDTANAARRAGRNDEASRVGNQARMLRDELDKIVPQYGNARATAAQFFNADDALAAGENFVGTKGTIGAAQKAWAGFSPPEKQLFKIGFVSNLIDKVSKAPDRSDIVRKVWGSSDARDRIRLALGPTDSKNLEAMMGVEALMDKSRKALGNSTTVRQLAELGTAGGVGAGGYGLLTGDWSMKDMSIAALLAAGGKRAGVRINQRVVNLVAQKLVSNDPAVYQSGIKALAQNPTLMKMLRGAVVAQTGAAVTQAVH